MFSRVHTRTSVRVCVSNGKVNLSSCVMLLSCVVFSWTEYFEYIVIERRPFFQKAVHPSELYLRNSQCF